MERSAQKILEPGRNCWDIVDVSGTGLLIDGRDYYRAFYRAAEGAERTILISGWQFDSDAHLLRGKDAENAEEVRLLSFLNHLCEKNKALQIYLLAWNFSVLYGLDREWFQQWYFNWTTNDRLKFCFDPCDALSASHHQKFVVVDGRMAFVGGLDLCSGRWDERDHRADNPNRINSDESPYRPFHDIHSYHVGPVAEKLAELFKQRWEIVCCESLELPPPVPESRKLPFESTLPVKAQRVAISRTQAATSDGNQEPVREIRQLFMDAIDAAQELVYIENQYFSSEALYKALAARMTQSNRPPIQIVMVLAKEADAFLEEISIGIAQVKILRHLRLLAADIGHSLGVYYATSMGPGGEEVPTYIHSKLLLVDDRFLSVGSANMNNRSMGLDTELNVSWEAAPDEDGLIQSIRDIRVDLLAEHTGVREPDGQRELGRIKGLVETLNRLATSGSSRLRHHPIENVAENYPWLTTFFPEGLPFDSEEPIFDEVFYEEISGKNDSFFTRGVTSLKNWLQNIGQKAEPDEETDIKCPSPPPRMRVPEP